MYSHEAHTQPTKPRQDGVRAFFGRIAPTRPEVPVQPVRAYPPMAVDLRDLDQRVREIGEW